MKKAKLYCDRCEKPIGEYDHSSDYPTIQVFDYSDGMDKHYLTPTLCLSCLVLVVQKLTYCNKQTTDKLREFVYD